METTLLLNSLQDERQILKEILKATRYVTGVQASSLILLDCAANELYFHAHEGGRAAVREIKLKLGEGIAGWVAKHNKPLVINDVSRDRRFSRRADMATGFVTKNILCVPLRSKGGLLGALEAINKQRGLFDAHDKIIFTAFAAQAAMALENARLYSYAFKDSLTGVYGRRYFESWLEKEFARARRYGSDFSLILLDIDRFKRVNDVYGHQAGDYVLAQTAGIIQSAVRSSDIPARFGGEEFVLILPNTPLKKAAVVAERIRLKVQNHAFNFSGIHLAVTVSLGAAGFKACRPNSPSDLVKWADKALYAAKNAGRNRVVCFP